MSGAHDETYKALADGHRRAILAALCDRAHQAGELARLVGLAPNALSFHLRWLRSARLVSVQREGRFLWYRIEAQTLAAWLADVNHRFQVEEGSGPTQTTSLEGVKRHRRPRRMATSSSRRPASPRPRSPRAVPPVAAAQPTSSELASEVLPTELL